MFITLVIALSAHAAIRVTPETGIVDPVRAPIDGEQSAPIVVTDGDQFLVLWINMRGVYVARVDAEGRLVSSRLAVPRTTGDLLTATWTGSVYLATWRDFAKAALVSATFSKTGDLLSGPVPVVGGMVGSVGVASNGHRTLLLYRYLDGVTPGVRAAIFDADGHLIRTNVAIPTPENAPRIASDGQEFALVWGTLKPDPGPTWSGLPIQDLHLLRMDEDGAAIGSPIDVGSVEQKGPLGFSFGGGRYAIAAFEGLFTPAGEQSRLSRFVVDARRGSVTKLPIVETTNASTNLSMLWSGSSFVAFWSRYPTPVNSGFDIMTLPFSGADESVAPAAVSAWTGNPGGSFFSMMSNGHQTMLVWPQDAGLYYEGRRSEIYGSLFDAAVPIAQARREPTLLSIGLSRQLQPLIASSPAGSLVVWIEDGDTAPFALPDTTGRRLLGMRTDAAGKFMDAVPFEIATGVSQAAVVFAGDVYVVAWQKNDVSAVRTVSVASPGLLVSLGPPISLGPGGYGITAASNGSTALVVFSESQSERLVGYRFNRWGQQIDTSPLVVGANGYDPQAASNGSDFFVAWSTGTDWSPFPSANLVDVLGTRITAAGTVDAAPLPIATGPRDERLFAAASDGRDYLVAYQLDQSESAVIATKRVLREGQLEGTTAADAGTIIARGEAYSIALSGDATGYWSAYAAGYWDAYSSTGNSDLLRLDKRGTPASSAVTFTATLSSVALGRLPGGAVRILYARAIDDGNFAGTTMVFSRFAEDDLSPRSRAVRH